MITMKRLTSYLHDSNSEIVNLIEECLVQDIRRSMQGNLRPVVTSIPVSSMYSIRSGGTKNRATSNSDSPLATSSSASSEPSVNNAFTCLDGSDAEANDARSEQGN